MTRCNNKEQQNQTLRGERSDSQIHRILILKWENNTSLGRASEGEIEILSMRLIGR